MTLVDRPNTIHQAYWPVPEENTLESGDVVVLNVVDESPSSISEIYNTI